MSILFEWYRALLCPYLCYERLRFEPPVKDSTGSYFVATVGRAFTQAIVFQNIDAEGDLIIT